MSDIILGVEARIMNQGNVIPASWIVLKPNKWAVLQYGDEVLE